MLAHAEQQTKAESGDRTEQLRGHFDAKDASWLVCYVFVELFDYDFNALDSFLKQFLSDLIPVDGLVGRVEDDGSPECTI